MILYDISTDLLSAKVYPGDPEPKAEQLFSMENGDIYNLSKIKHSGSPATRGLFIFLFLIVNFLLTFNKNLVFC